MTIFWCEDSLDGILTGIYDAWDSRLGHNQVKLKTDAQDTLELFCDYRQVKTDAVKAEKVLRTIRDRLWGRRPLRLSAMRRPVRTAAGQTPSTVWSCWAFI